MNPKKERLWSLWVQPARTVDDEARCDQQEAEARVCKQGLELKPARGNGAHI